MGYHRRHRRHHHHDHHHDDDDDHHHHHHHHNARVIIRKKPRQNRHILITPQRRPQPLNVVRLPPALRNVVVESHEEESVEAHCSVQRSIGGCVTKRVNLPSDGGHEAQLLVQEGVPDGGGGFRFWGFEFGALSLGLALASFGRSCPRSAALPRRACTNHHWRTTAAPPVPAPARARACAAAEDATT